MDLTDEDIATFITAWKQDVGELITPEHARAAAQSLLVLYANVAGIALPLSPPPDVCATSSTAGSPPNPRTDKSSPSTPNVGKPSD